MPSKITPHFASEVGGIITKRPSEYLGFTYKVKKSCFNHLWTAARSTLLRHLLVSLRMTAAGSQEDFLLLAPICNRGQFHHRVEGDL